MRAIVKTNAYTEAHAQQDDHQNNPCPNEYQGHSGSNNQQRYHGQSMCRHQHGDPPSDFPVHAP